MSFLYCCVVSEGSVIVEHFNVKRDDKLFLKEIIQTGLDSKKSCIKYKKYKIHVLKDATSTEEEDEGEKILCFIAVSDAELNQLDGMKFLDDLKKIWMTKYGGKIVLEKDGEIEKYEEFSQIMQEKMTASEPKPKVEDEDITRAKSEIKKVSEKMGENINNVLLRGDELNNIAEQAGELDETSRQFNDASANLRRGFFRRNLKIIIIVAVIIILVIFILFLVACRGVNCLSLFS